MPASGWELSWGTFLVALLFAGNCSPGYEWTSLGEGTSIPESLTHWRVWHSPGRRILVPLDSYGHRSQGKESLLCADAVYRPTANAWKVGASSPPAKIAVS